MCPSGLLYGEIMTNFEYTKFIETRTAPYSRWKDKDTSFIRPDSSVSKPLDQCKFVMTQLGKEKSIVPVDMWGNSIDPFNPSKILHFRTTRTLWADDYGQTFDGYAAVLDKKPSPVLINDQEYWLVAGLHFNCINVSDRTFYISEDFQAVRFSLGEPLCGICPNQRDAYWFGLSPEPITGGKNESTIISSYNQIIPIGLELGEEVLPLPIGAEKIINNILGV